MVEGHEGVGQRHAVGAIRQDVLNASTALEYIVLINNKTYLLTYCHYKKLPCFSSHAKNFVDDLFAGESGRRQEWVARRGDF